MFIVLLAVNRTVFAVRYTETDRLWIELLTKMTRTVIDNDCRNSDGIMSVGRLFTEPHAVNDKRVCSIPDGQKHHFFPLLS